MTTTAPIAVQPRKAVARTERTSISRVVYEDGSSDLCDLVLREPEGLTIVGGGTLPSPLTVAIASSPMPTRWRAELERQLESRDREGPP